MFKERELILKIIPSFIELETGEGIALHDLMPGIKDAIANSGIKNGFVTVTSQHTNTASDCLFLIAK
jgi:thiamine phosphate synthase YjbQ (UPF0047 family)